MFMSVVGPFQIVLITLVPVGIFLLGFSVGKKSGYIKRVREMENKTMEK